MKKNILAILLIATLLITGCSNNDSKRFKTDYESVNGKINKNGLKHRKVTIDKKNPFVYSTPKEIIKKIENKETFYVYFGSELCPWCRSVIEQAITSSNKNNIKKIYYVDIWNEDADEILRDKYKLNNGKLELVKDGTNEYKKLLKYFDNILPSYILTDENGNEFNTNEKRIFAPNYIYVKNGKAVKLVEGISELQENSRGLLTKEIKKDQLKQFNELFSE